MYARLFKEMVTNNEQYNLHKWFVIIWKWDSGGDAVSEVINYNQ